MRQKLGNEKICLFLDNLRVHKTKKVMEAYVTYDIEPIFNEIYSPDYNPIETIFSQVKRRYKELRLNKLANGKVFNEADLIRQVFA